MGNCYKEALKIANMNRIMHIVSKNECDEESIKSIINKRYQANIIIPYTANMCERDFLRRTLSVGFTCLINFLTRNNIKYYNGTVLYKTNLLKSIKFSADYHTFQAEALLKLIKYNSFLEIPVKVNWNKKHKSTAFKLKNIFSVTKFIFKVILRLV